MIRSSFASFTTARLAIQANQNALAIVGQNMGNAKTPGYTRQRLDQISINNEGNYSTYEANPTAHIGSGVWVTGVSQIRDPFLDTRYRMEMGNLGKADKRLAILGEIGDKLDETDRAAIKAQLGDLGTQLNTLLTSVGSDSNDSLVRSSMDTLTSLFRSYSDSLNSVQEGLTAGTTNDIKDVNNILVQIQKMNVTIKNNQAHGNPALELQDSRNLLIDELSTYGNIKVTYTTDITMSGSTVDSLRIDLLGDSESGIQSMNLINDVSDPAQFAFHQPKDGSEGYSISLKDSLGNTHQNVTSDKGVLTSALGLLNAGGEFDKPPSDDRGVNYYRKAIDNLANTFATVFNDLNTCDGMGGALLATNDGSDVITAGNISISKPWQNGTLKILASRNPDEPNQANSNIANMINALEKPQTFMTPNDTISYQGSFYSCFDHIINVQAMDQKATQTTYDNYLSITGTIASSKDSVSGVSMDEESMNMLQYNSALTAASRLMTTLDEALNTIINSMGVVGR